MDKTTAMQIWSNHPHYKSALQVGQVLYQAGYRTLFAGGCVRDGCLGLVPKDFDIATEALPEQVEQLFPKILDVGRSFGVLRVLARDSQWVEVATFRKDGPSQDGRRPDWVTFCKEKEDALRRDFTVNALFFDPKEWGGNNQVVDYVNGLSDLKQKIIKAVGDPGERFEEDHLRMLRAVRLKSQLNFNWDPLTFDSLKQKAEGIRSVSGERIRDEMHKFFDSPQIHWQDLWDSGLVFQLFPFLMIQKKKERIALFLDCLFEKKSPFPLDPHTLGWIEFFLSFESISENQLTLIFDRLKFSKDQIKFIRTFLKASQMDIPSFLKEPLGKWIEEILKSPAFYWGIMLFVSQSAGESLNFAEVQKRLQTIQHRCDELHWTKPEPYVKALDLIQDGITNDLNPVAHKQGRELGIALEKCYHAQLEGLVHSTKAAIEWFEQQEQTKYEQQEQIKQQK